MGVPPSAFGVDPNWCLARYFKHLAGCFVWYVLRAGFNASGCGADLVDRHNGSARQGTLQHRFDDRVGVLVGTIAEHAHVHPVLDSFVAAGTNGHVLQPHVDGGNQLVALAFG